MNILYIGHEFLDEKIGGNIGRKNHYNSLKSIYKQNLYEVFYKFTKKHSEILKNYLLLRFNGQNYQKDKEILKIIEKERIKKIIFDSSIFGNLIKKIKKKYPQIEIITFFHNIERNFYKERIKVEGITRYILLPSIIYNENLSVKYSDKLILLNKREIIELKKIYTNKLKNKRVYEIPLYLEDRYDSTKKLKKCEYDYLFIGSAFYANLHGISWFIENVLPNVTGKLVVIGKGMEVLKNKYQNSKKLEIKGTVENIDDYYYDDNLVISPIFHGAGMKTKTIEAMMFNKFVIGTSEAFVGVEKKEIINNNFGEICNTKEEFIKILKNRENKIVKKSRNLFLKKYSTERNNKKIEEIIKG